MKGLRKVKRSLVDPCLEEEESYIIRSRKYISLAVAAFIAFNASVLGFPVAVILIQDDASSTGAYLFGAAVLVFAIAGSVMPYTHLRITKKLPDWLVDFQIWFTIPMTLTFCLFIHEGSASILIACGILIAVVTRIRGWPLMVLYGLAISVLHSLINNFDKELPALHVAFYNKQPLSVRIVHLFGINICLLFFFALGLYGIMVEFGTRANQADAAIAMNLAVAEKLCRFDTDGLAVMLGSNRGKVDDSLLDAYASIQRNLQSYRPHIPDYIIAATTTNTVVSKAGVGGDIYDEGGIVDDDCTQSSDSIQSLHVVHKTISMGADSNRATHDRFKPMSLLSDDEASNPRSGPSSFGVLSGSGGETFHKPEKQTPSKKKHRRNHNSPCNHSSYISAHPPVSVTALLGSDSRKASIDNTFAISPGPSSSTATFNTTTDVPVLKIPHEALLNNHPLDVRKKEETNTAHKIRDQNQVARGSTYFYGRVTTVFVRFVSDACGSDSSGTGTVPRGSKGTAMKALSRCVEAATKHAKTFHGALQYLQGCGLMVSFNAASRIANHERKACAFALALYDEIDSVQYSTSVVMHATIVTSSNVLSYFAGSRDCRMLTVLGDFMLYHTAMHQYLSETVGSDASCVLLTDGVVQTVDVFYTSRRLGSITIATSKNLAKCKNIVVSQLLTQKEDQHGADEWMYATITSTEISEETAAIDTTNRLVDQVIHGGCLVGEKDNITDTTLFSYVSALATSDDDVVLHRCVAQRIQNICLNVLNGPADLVDDQHKASTKAFTVTIAPTIMW